MPCVSSEWKRAENKKLSAIINTELTGPMFKRKLSTLGLDETRYVSPTKNKTMRADFEKLENIINLTGNHLKKSLKI